jgi:hypothetical protein
MSSRLSVHVAEGVNIGVERGVGQGSIVKS